MIALVVGLAVAVGAVIPVQTSINTRLARHLGVTLLASLVSFGVGTVGLALAVLVTRAPLPIAATASTQPWWVWTGGVCGLVFLTTNMVLFPRIGASATVILPLFGQVLGGLVIDVLGAFGTVARPLTVARVVGVLLVALGAVFVNWRRRTSDTPAASWRTGLLYVAGVCAGALGAIQATVNGRVGQVMGSPLAGALVSFTVGFAGLVVINLVARNRPRVAGRAPWWSLTGGLIGAGFVATVTYVTPILGTSLAVSATLLGQVAGGLTLDHLGAFGSAPRRLNRRRLLGAGLVLGGVALIRFAG